MYSLSRRQRGGRYFIIVWAKAEGLKGGDWLGNSEELAVAAV